MIVIFTPTAQHLICEHCRAHVAPVKLLPTLLFVIFGAEFTRKHRFCETRAMERNANG